MLDTLSEREAGVVSMRFGLTDGQPKTLDEIGKIYGVTPGTHPPDRVEDDEQAAPPSRSQILRDYLGERPDDGRAVPDQPGRPRPARSRPASGSTPRQQESFRGLLPVEVIDARGTVEDSAASRALGPGCDGRCTLLAGHRPLRRPRGRYRQRLSGQGIRRSAATGTGHAVRPGRGQGHRVGQALITNRHQGRALLPVDAQGQ